MDPKDIAPFPLLSLDRSVWAIRREALSRLAAAHRIASDPAWADVAAAGAARAAKAAVERADQRAPGGVAVITLAGIITPRGSFLSMLFGGSSGGLMSFREEFREAVASPDVAAIVLDIDSPGGLYDLVPETAAEVYGARGSKPIIAVCNTMAASAAYYVASQADEIVATPSGQAGSIGVYIVHEDWSGFNEQMGIDPTYISAGKYKTEGNMDEPLSNETREVWQAEMDDLYTKFVDTVAVGRGVSADDVRSGYGEGRVLYADRAVEVGLVDRIDTLETVIGEQLVAGAGGGGAAARASRIVTPTVAPRAEVVPPPAGDETDPARDQPPAEPAHVPVEEPAPANDPTHVPDDAPVDDLGGPPDPVVPDVGPDADPPPAETLSDAEARAVVAELLVS